MSQELLRPSLSSSSDQSSSPATSSEWWRTAVIYQVYPRSFADSNGDGMGDVPGITARLPYLAELGVDGLWISPFYTSPQADAGYDVADYRDIDPTFGTLGDVEELLTRAEDLGLKVMVDLVPNHTSDEHAWFQTALAAGPGSPERERYVFREGRGDDGSTPPNNWRSVFGGRAWSRVTEPDGSPGQWYLHLFDTKQPDLNWEHPEVIEEFHDILRFWLDRGVAGFRVDVAHGLVKAQGLPDWDAELELLHGTSPDGKRPPMWDQDGVHEIYRGWRRVLDEYDGERCMVAEAWVEPPERLARYVRPDEMQQAFNFDFLECEQAAAPLRRVIQESIAADDAVGAPTTWVLSNHDVVRHTTRLGLPFDPKHPIVDGLTAESPQPDAALGLRRARAATALMLALPGSAYLYQGEELGLPDHTALPAHVRQDPSFIRTEGRHIGRDGCRVPLPWTGGAPGNGFGPSAKTWLPQPEVYAELAADRQEAIPGSTLELYRALLATRRAFGLGLGGVDFVDADAVGIAPVEDPHGPGETAWDGDVLAMRRGAVTVVANLGSRPVLLPADAEVLVVSDSLTSDGERLILPGYTTVWLRSSLR